MQVNRYRRVNPPESLSLTGPRITVSASLPQAVIDMRGGDLTFEAEALIDTGASNTSISPRIAQALQLKSTNRVQSMGVHGVGYSNVYTINFTFTGSGINLQNWQVLEFDNAGQSFDMLIGRDVLAHSLLVYDGATGAIGLEIPSAHHPLDKTPWVGSPIVRSVPSTPSGLRAVAQKKRHKLKQQKVARRKNRKKK